MDLKLTFYPIYLRYKVCTSAYGNQTLSRQEDKRFPSGKFSYSWERNGPQASRSAFLAFGLFRAICCSALSARLAFFALCYRAIACFLRLSFAHFACLAPDGYTAQSCFHNGLSVLLCSDGESELPPPIPPRL